ncbi:MAG: substrate-binding and VWA domain-containing protein [Intrasporangium sp.]|uniref:substrate-binding and VWA domain-containing protein n=1 Tax=Intrasporangium sp. TaxID=1925024 RepID=UPI0026496AFF|nr:substrate-binding and VWA domain-containing protein [Intrasporangium sp.]MDN5794270.1 substrate-binding and VWA domain-containing protein [Intrasporangium sp.]
MTDDDRVPDGQTGPPERGVPQSRAAHRAAEARIARVRRRRSAAATSLAVMVAVVAGFLTWSNSDAAPGSLSAPPAKVAAAPVKTCPTHTSVTVWASSAMEAAATDLTRAYAATADAPCVNFVVTAHNPVESILGLGKTQPNRPDAWIPDSPRWVDRVNAAAGIDATHTPPFARSPLVIAMSPQGAASLPGTPQWSELVSGAVPTRFSDPRSTTAGMLALTAALPTLDGASGAATIKRLARTTAPSTEDLFAAFRARPTESAAFPVSEAALLAYDKAHPDQPMVPVVPTEGTPPFEYSLVNVTTDRSRSAAVESLRRYLFTPEAAKILAEHGLRPASVGTPVPTVTGGVGTIRIGVTPSEVQVAAAADTWQAATVGFRILSVFDVSGSMREKVGGSTRIAVTQEAAGIALRALPKDTDLGVWAFSIGIGRGGADYRELAPIRLLTDAAHRKAVAVAAASLSRYVGGGTGLYDTIWAAYRRVQQGYDPTRVNAVVVLTDGKNEDPKGISLRQLKDNIVRAADPKRPVAVMTIGIGLDVDATSLTDISRMTNSNFYSAPKPQDMTRVLSKALFDHECRDGVCV